MAKLKDILSEAFEDRPQIDKHKVVEGVRNFGIVGKSLYNNNNIMETAKQLPKFSSKEAKTIIDNSVRQYATLLRKAEAKIIKDWMSKAKSGAIDYFDIVRGLQTGDVSRAYPFELRFLKGILDRDKIMNRFRSYFKGKKGKKR